MSLRLQSLNQKTLTDYHSHHGVFYGFVFDFLLILIVPWQDKWDLRRILVWGQVWGEKVCPHTYPHHWNPDKQGASAILWGCEGKRKKTFFIVQGNGHAVLSAFYMASKVKTKQWLSKRLQGHFEEVAVQSYALQKSGDRWNNAFLFCSKKLSK